MRLIAFLVSAGIVCSLSLKANADYRSRDDAASLMTAGLLQRKETVSPDLFTRYWRDVHGPLAARIKGFEQYWQHHLGAPLDQFWPFAVSQSPEDNAQIQGFAETTFKTEEARDGLGKDQAAQALFYDEQNVFRATYLYPSKTGNSRTLLNRLENGAPNGPSSFPTYIVFIQRRAQADREDLRTYLRSVFAPFLASRSELRKVRLHLLEPFDPKAWDTPGVSHSLDASGQYDAILELVFADENDEKQLLISKDLAAQASQLTSLIASIHTYPVWATYTLVYDGRPTLEGLKGLPVAAAIKDIEARNQTSAAVLKILNGPDVETPSGLPAGFDKNR